MNTHIKGLMVCCSVVVATLLAAPAWAAAPDAGENPAPTSADLSWMSLEQLDEVVLEGKRLEQRVAESEARFYKRYSQLNSKDDFDVSCTFEWEDGTMGPSARRRSCVPAFYLKAVGMELSLLSPAPTSCGDGVQRALDGVTDGSTMQPWHTSSNIYGSGGFDGGVLSSYGGGFASSRLGCALNSPLRRISNRPNLVYLDKRAEFLANLLRVVNSDQQLRAMAGELDALAEEGKVGKQRAAEAARLRRTEEKCARPVSPRVVTVCNSKGRA